MKSKKGGLGKGLDALFDNRAPIVESKQNENLDISTDKHEDTAAKVMYIDINQIKPNENQPRKHFNEEKINELSSSIIEHGIIQPLVLRKIDEKRYEIVAGERRWRAARAAGLEKVPSIIRDFTDEENMIIAIIENMQREDLNSIEEAEGLRQMIETYGFTQEEVSRSVSKSRPYITNALRLLKLPENIQEKLARGQISPGHGRALLAAKDKSYQEKLCDRIINEGLSVRKTEELANNFKSKKVTKTKREKDVNILQVERDLKEIYGTKISIINKGQKGVLKIEYYGEDELNRIIDLLKLAK